MDNESLSQWLIRIDGEVDNSVLREQFADCLYQGGDRECLEHLDDRVVRDAITSIVHKTPAPSNPVQTLVQQLGRARKETGCSEEVWQDGLRVVYRSLSTTSKCRSGEITYIIHAAQFLGIT